MGCADGSVRRAVAWPDAVEAAASLPEPGPRLRVLSPFDPALRDRKRAERLFGFHYRIEIFVPEAQRRHGYYVFPVLEGTRLAGRIDMAVGRGRTCLKVRAFWPEPGVRMGSGRRQRLVDEIERVAVLAECGECGVRTGLAPREPLTCAQLIHMWISGFLRSVSELCVPGWV